MDKFKGLIILRVWGTHKTRWEKALQLWTAINSQTVKWNRHCSESTKLSRRHKHSKETILCHCSNRIFMEILWDRISKSQCCHHWKQLNTMNCYKIAKTARGDINPHKRPNRAMQLICFHKVDRPCQLSEKFRQHNTPSILTALICLSNSKIVL